MYRHELAELFLYYNASEAALMIGPDLSDGLVRLEKRPGVEMPSNVNYSSHHLFDFSRWKQWDPVQYEFDEIGTGSAMTPVCVDQNFGYCNSGILHPKISDAGLHAVNVFGPGDEVPNTTLNITEVRFKLRLGKFHNVRPVYDLVSDVETIPYYLYHENGKWQVGTEIGSESGNGRVILETESDTTRAEYELQSEWYAASSVGLQVSALSHLQCSRPSAGYLNCQNAVCDNGGHCHEDFVGTSTCICTPDFRGIHCETPVAKCVQTVSFHSPSFAFSDREGSIRSTFCSSGRVLLSVCDGLHWWPYGSSGCRASRDISTTTAVLPANTTSASSVSSASALPEFIERDAAAKIALVIASLVGFQLVLPFICYCCISCCKFDENKLTTEVMRPARERLTKFLRACSGFFYFSWWAWFVFLIYYLCVWHGHVALDGTTVWSAVAIMAIICVCLLYVVVLCESICSREYEYLTKVKDVMLAEEQITHMKSELPTIKFKAECWHAETRTRTVYSSAAFSFLQHYAASLIL